MAAADIARRHNVAQAYIAGLAATQAIRLWRTVRPNNIAKTWLQRLADIIALVSLAQLLSARRADPYVTEMLDAQGIDPAAVGQINPRAFAGLAADGRPLGLLLYRPVIEAKVAIGAGESIERAMARGQAALVRSVTTEIADAGRTAVGTAIVARPAVTGYVRMVSPGSCARCIILAGRWYRYDAAFDRHPYCGCTACPAAEDAPDDVGTDPAAYFRSLPRGEQDRVFTEAGAQAIRDGADMGQVVNARRGMYSTADGAKATRSGGQPGVRLMPEQIYTQAADRAEALVLLRQHGYLR